MARARYQIDHGDGDALHLVDLGPWDQHPTVTNDAEAVVRDLHRAGRLGRRRLFYRDSEGQVDEIRHDGQGRFLGFAPGPQPTT